MLQSLAVPPAEIHAGAVLQHDAIVAVVPGLDLPDAIDVDQVSAVYPDETPAIELLLQGGQRLAPGVSGALGIHIDVVAVRLHPIDVGDGDDVFAVQLAYDE